MTYEKGTVLYHWLPLFQQNFAAALVFCVPL